MVVLQTAGGVRSRPSVFGEIDNDVLIILQLLARGGLHDREEKKLIVLADIFCFRCAFFRRSFFLRACVFILVYFNTFYNTGARTFLF